MTTLAESLIGKMYKINDKLFLIYDIKDKNPGDLYRTYKTYDIEKNTLGEMFLNVYMIMDLIKYNSTTTEYYRITIVV